MRVKIILNNVYCRNKSVKHILVLCKLYYLYLKPSKMMKFRYTLILISDNLNFTNPNLNSLYSKIYQKIWLQFVTNRQ